MKNYITFLLCVLCFYTLAKENPATKKQSHSTNNKVAVGCVNTIAQADIDISNVRAKVFTGGDMWWDLAGNAKYEVPKGSGKTCMFSGSVWIGGVDGNGQLKVAAQTYRQNGNDYWAGPISKDPVTGVTSIDIVDCNYYDRIWKVTKADVQTLINTGVATADIQQWPGNGDLLKHQLHFLAPFYDANANGLYEPNNVNPIMRDYPYYNFSNNYPVNANCGGSLDCSGYLYGDQTLWYVFNDVGNIKTESNSDPIGIEVRAQAFSFVTGTGVDNCTFYKYQIINRSTVSFDSTYFGAWADPDLGFYNDDFVGCDVTRGLSFCYNGDATDNLPDGYGVDPPAIGIDFLQGPRADSNDGIDNDRDGTTDEPCEEIIMSNFVSFINDNNLPNGNPSGLNDFYHYLTSSWRDGLPVTWGGTGYNPGSTDQTNFTYPGTTDPGHVGLDWTEVTAGNTPTDKRCLMSAGAFTLPPGAANHITTSVIWARTAPGGGPLGSVSLLEALDDTIQSWFSTCFNSTQLGLPELNITTVNCYPNPMFTSTKITVSSYIGKKLTLTVWDTEGKAVEQQTTSSGEFIVEKKTKKQGVYFYQVKNANNAVFNGKFMIQQ